MAVRALARTSRWSARTQIRLPASASLPTGMSRPTPLLSRMRVPVNPTSLNRSWCATGSSAGAEAQQPGQHRAERGEHDGGAVVVGGAGELEVEQGVHGVPSGRRHVVVAPAQPRRRPAPSPAYAGSRVTSPTPTMTNRTPSVSRTARSDATGGAGSTSPPSYQQSATRPCVLGRPRRIGPGRDRPP